MSQEQAPHSLPAPAAEARQTAGHPPPAQRDEHPGTAAMPVWDRAFQDCPWDEDPECICAENTLQEAGRGVDREEPDI